jgi:hypothetical protein
MKVFLLGIAVYLTAIQPALAFNAMWFSDPSFVVFLGIEVPLVFCTIATLIDIIFLRVAFRGSIHAKHSVSLLLRNLFVYYGLVLLSIMVLIILAKTLDESPPIITQIALVYFAISYCYFAYLGLVSWVGRKHPNALERRQKIQILLLKTLEYLGLYLYLREMLF